MKLSYRFNFFSIAILIVSVFSCSGCIELLELGEVEELGAAGIEVEELGT